jgi:ppGpp synthetase/RelA/SpoT-type nucleotidyltranferase
MKDDKRNGFVLNCGMAWAKPEYTRKKVNEAGEILISSSASFDEIDDALKVVNNWRSIHACPLQSMKMTLTGRAKKQDATALIAQRTKRIQAIIFKLTNHRMGNLPLKLSQMHDIGGCRAVLRSVSQVESLVKAYEDATAKNALRGGRFHRKYDYIKEPKSSGYRSVHLVYKYFSTSIELGVYDDLKIEIQIRSKLQHAWATAVETVGFFTGQALKSNIGEASWKRFFALVSNEFARLEKRPLVPETPRSPVVSKLELNSFSTQIDLLEGLKTATRIVENKEGHYYLLELDLQARTVRTTVFQKNQMVEAQEKYLEVEKANKDTSNQAVLVSVDSLAALPKAYPNYYLDITEFVKVLKKILAT